MSLPAAAELLQGSQRAADLRPLLVLAESARRTWEARWSDLLDAALREEAEQRLAGLSELSLMSWGGHPAAERRRLLLQRREVALEVGQLDPGLQGLEISGNFLFDPAEPADLRTGIRQALLQAMPAGPGEGAIGDVWIRGDRGGQAILLESAARLLEGCEGQVRSVPVRFQLRPIAELQLPAPRLPKRLQSVEASLRLDAVASAGFGLSRSRMVERIRQGAVRVDWRPVTSPSRELALGERVQLDGRGELTIMAIQATQRGRWRIEMERR